MNPLPHISQKWICSASNSTASSSTISESDSGNEFSCLKSSSDDSSFNGAVDSGGSFGVESGVCAQERRAAPLTMIWWMAETISDETISILSELINSLRFTESDRKRCRESILVRTVERLRSGTLESELPTRVWFGLESSPAE